jgi:hypothetical protein
VFCCRIPYHLFPPHSIFRIFLYSLMDLSKVVLNLIYNMHFMDARSESIRGQLFQIAGCKHIYRSLYCTVQYCV